MNHPPKNPPQKPKKQKQKNGTEQCTTFFLFLVFFLVQKQQKWPSHKKIINVSLFVSLPSFIFVIHQKKKKAKKKAASTIHRVREGDEK
eukprot:m.151852 g.151852  ORF g.151852 m.151852 type:complete len:89 (+) comp30783_c2_seq2:2073-2339(+)